MRTESWMLSGLWWPSLGPQSQVLSPKCSLALFAPIFFIAGMQATPPLGGPETAMVGSLYV